jgi:hypothetical protein
MSDKEEKINEFIQSFRRYVMNVKIYDEIKKYLGMEFRFVEETNQIILHQQEYIKISCEDMVKMIKEDQKINSRRKAIRKIPMSPQYSNEIEDDNEEELNELYSVMKLKYEEENKLLPAIGTLRYICDNTRPDILSAVGIASIGSNMPNKKNYIAVKQIYDYILNTKDLGIRLGGTDKRIELFGFSDASLKHRRLGGCFYIGYNTGAIDSFSTREETISHSSTEAEIKALDKVVIKTIVYRKLLEELGCKQMKPTKIFVDSKSSVEICEAFMTTKNTQHINRKIQFIREQINKREIQLIFIRSELNIADILTKPLGNDLFAKHRERLLNGIDEQYMQELMKNVKIFMHNEEYSTNNIIIEVY